jgi:hypothetical protein
MRACVHLVGLSILDFIYPSNDKSKASAVVFKIYIRMDVVELLNHDDV